MDREDTAARYLRGECMTLADALHRATGAPLVAIHDATWDSVPRHVGVEVSPGRYADARGASLDRTAFLAGYGAEDAEIRPIAAERMRSIWGRRIETWEVPDRDLAVLGLDQRSLAAASLEMRTTSASLRGSKG
jgi:hypothetical protein